VKLATVDSGRVGRLDGEDVIELDRAAIREWFERADDVTEATITGIGTLRHEVAPWTAAHNGPPHSTGPSTSV
jgi:hypothetical protein